MNVKNEQNLFKIKNIQGKPTGQPTAQPTGRPTGQPATNILKKL
jgi:hypothetical protein